MGCWVGRSAIVVRLCEQKGTLCNAFFPRLSMIAVVRVFGVDEATEQQKAERQQYRTHELIYVCRLNIPE